MNSFATLMLLGWAPAMLVLFALVPVRKAILVCGIGGWLLLPQLTYQLPGLPFYEKSTAICLPLLLGCLITDARTLLATRLRWWDLPMAVWIVSAFCSAVANDTGVYDGVYVMLYRLLDWGVPYWLGRTYFATPRDARLLLWGIFAGGLAYVLPALWEIRMSPQLHHIVYGGHQHSWEQAMRGGGYRPLVFTQHGLALSLWMAAATLAGVSLWRQRAATHVLGVPMLPLVALVGVTMVLCKSFGATILLGVGALILLAPFGRLLHASILVALPIYLLLRMTGWGGIDTLIDGWVSLLPPDRAASLQYRLDNEAILIARGWEKPVFGWTPWSFLDPVVDEHGILRIIVSDSMWIINFVVNGLVGLTSITAVMLLPGARAAAARGRSGAGVRIDDLAALGVIVTLFQIDCLVNAFLAPAYVLAAGAVVGLRAGRYVASREPSAAAVVAAAMAPAGRRLEPRPAVTAGTLHPRWPETRG